MPDPKPPPTPPALVPLGPPIALSGDAALRVLIRVTRADVLAARVYWARHATALPTLLDEPVQALEGSQNGS